MKEILKYPGVDVDEYFYDPWGNSSTALQMAVRHDNPNLTKLIISYTLSAYKCHKGNSKKVISKKFRKWFHSCTCILPDYVSDGSSKEF